jgi:hypothetical protein
MTDQDKKENLSGVEKEPVSPGQEAEFKQEAVKAPERIEAQRDSEIVSAELKRELEMMQLDEKAKGEIEKAKEKIEFLGEKEKIEHLLQIAREKGVVFAVQLARKMNEPYLLDLLHDTLAREGYYKDFTK